MFETIFKFIMEHWPIGAVVTIAVVATWQVSKFYHHWDKRICSTEDDCKRIDSHVLPEVKNIGNTVNTMVTSVNALVLYLKLKDNAMDTSLFRAQSPIELTELGLELLTEIGGKTFVDENISALYQAMERLNVKTAFDVQNSATIVIGQSSISEGFKPIKNYLYAHPNYIAKSNYVTFAIDFNTATSVMGLYLRNCYLKTHPELDFEPDTEN